MSLSDFEIGKIAEIVAGKSGAKLDAKALRQVIDRVVDSLKEQQRNPEIEDATCETGKPVPSQSGVDAAREAMLSKPPALPTELGAPQLAVGSSPPPPDEALITAEGGAIRADREDRQDARDHRRVRQGPSRCRRGAHRCAGRAQLFD